MEPVADGTQAADPAPARLSLDLFSEIYQSQMANGLRQKNFIRYRAYCSRRLRRLRKSVRFLHGKGKFVPKKIQAEVAQHPRHLLILLNLTERAWAHAMEIKTDVVEEASRSRFHMHRRLSKAMRWAQHLVAICENRADTLTHLQAECYCSWMSGNVYLENEQLDKALTAFAHSLKILNSLLDVAETEQQRKIYRSRIALVQPSVRFCQYKTEQGGTPSSDLASGADLDVVLSSKLAAARQERDAQIIATAVDHVTYKHRRIPIKSESVKNAIAKAIDMKAAIDDSTPPNAFLACFDALDIARSAIASSLKNSELVEPDKAALVELQNFVAFNKLQVTMHRDLGLFKQLMSQFDQGSRAALDDLVVMCEKILSSLSSLEAHEFDDHTDLQARFAAHRFFYLGSKLAAQHIWEGAMYFFEKSITAYPTSDTDWISRARQASILARLSMHSEEDSQEVVDPSKVPLLHRLQHWHEGSGLIMELPPSFVSTYCKPVQFDLAAAGLTYPPLENKLSRRTSTATGWLSRLWG